MTFKFYSIALLAALTTAATAQTTAAAHHTTTKTTTTHHAAPPVSSIPRVHGIPHTLYSLKYIDIVVGKGPLAQTHKWNTVKYTGWFPNGTKFDSSYDHPGGQPFIFPYGARQVIIGWDTGFEGMHIGGKRRLFVPYQLAYGELGNPPRMPAKADLIFDVELVAQSDTRPEPQSPPAPKPSTEPQAKPAPASAPQPAQEAKPATPESQPKTTSNPKTH